MADAVNTHRRSIGMRLSGRRGGATGGPPFRVRCARVASLGLVVPLTLALPAHAQEWQRTLRLDLNTIVSDNPLLRPRGFEQSDVVLRTSPVIGLSRETGRLRLNARYAPVILGYVNDSLEETLFNVLDAKSTYELVDRRLFLEGKAFVNQMFLSPFGSQPPEFATGSFNRMEIRTVSLSPYVRGPLRGGGNYTLRNDNTFTTFSTQAVVDIVSNQFSGQVNGPQGGLVALGADAAYGITSFGGGSSLVNQTATARASFNIDPEFVPYVTGGYEYNEYFQAVFSGARYGGGFRWQPSPRTQVNVGVEKRYFGTAFNVDASYRTRLGLWSLTAYRTDRVTGQQPGFGFTNIATRDYLSNLLGARFPDETQRALEVDRLMTIGQFPETLSARSAFSSPRVLLTEGFEPSVAFNGVRNTVLLTYFWRRSAPISTNPGIGAVDVFNVVNGFEQNGVAVSWTHKFTSRTSFLTAVDAFRTDSIRETSLLPNALSTDQTIFRFFLTHELTPDTTATAGVRFTRLLTDNDPGASFDSRERALQFGVVHKFF